MGSQTIQFYGFGSSFSHLEQHKIFLSVCLLKQMINMCFVVQLNEYPICLLLLLFLQNKQVLLKSLKTIER